MDNSVWLTAGGTPSSGSGFVTRGGYLKRIIPSAFALCVSITACSSTEPLRGAFSGATYVLAQSAGQPLPVSLDNDTLSGTAHYSLVADTLQFDAQQPLITGTVVVRLDYVGTTSPPIFQSRAYEYQYSRAGDAGTAQGICLPPGAPCAPLTAAFFISGDSLFLQHTPSQSFDTYLRIR